MRISLNWLKQYVDIPKNISPEELALKLTMSTVEVERVIDQRRLYDQMVVGEITELADHPGADKLKVCKVKAGREEYQVVCGGSNLRLGMKGILALPGAMVRWHGQGEPVKLAKAKIRGVESSGMLCAASEIGLPEEQSEPLAVVDLGESAESGRPAADALGLDDIVFEIDNKSINHRPDLWGHYGLAREVAALLGLKLKPLELAKYSEGHEADLTIKIEDRENCTRYIGLLVGNIKIEPSPLWLQRLLKSAGVRPINNIVDITNYVMLELGRPSHAFDRRNVLGDTIIARRAKEGEKFVTLDGQSRILTAKMCLICDAKRAIDLAGIMGGENSQIKADTTEVILELANFNPSSIRRTAAALGLRTDAAARFEKGLEPALARLGLDRIITLILKLIPEARVLSKVVDVNYDPDQSREIELGLDFLDKRLGQALPRKEAVKILESLFFEVREKKDILLVKPPSFRTRKDISLPEDLVEEIARIYGFDNIEPAMPLVSLEPPFDNPEQMLEKRIRQVLISGGATEVLNYSFIGQRNLDLLGIEPAGHLELKNYLTEDQRYLRASLFENLIANLEDNLRFFEDFNLFELGRVFSKEPGEFRSSPKGDFLAKQPKLLGGLIIGGTEKVFLKAKGLVERLLNSLEIGYNYSKTKSKLKWLDSSRYLEAMAGNEVLGWVSELNPKVLERFRLGKGVAVWQLELSGLLKHARDNKKYQPLPKYPGMTYDFSILVDEKTQWAELRKEVMETSPLVKKAELFDLYQGGLGERKKSVAFHVVLRDEDKTLTSEEGDSLKEKIINSLKKKFKAEIR